MHKKQTMHKQFFNIVPSKGEVAILLYGDIGNGEKVDSSRIVAELLSLEQTYEKIDVRINSNGGDVFSGMAIYNALRSSKANITIYIDGVGASIAGIIALCGKPLYMSPYAKLMLHSVSGGAYGNASELRHTAELIETLQNDLASMIASKAGLSKEQILARYFDEKDHWITAQQALDMKFIDGIYDWNEEEVKASTTEELYTYFNNRLVKEPLNTNEMTLKEQLSGISSFANLADDNAVLNHIKDLENKATKVDALESAVKSYKEKLETLEAKEINAFVDNAIAQGKITQEQKATFLALMKSDRKNAEQLLSTLAVNAQRRASSVYNEGRTLAGDLLSKTWDELDRAGELSALRSNNIEAFRAKYKERFGFDYKE